MPASSPAVPQLGGQRARYSLTEASGIQTVPLLLALGDWGRDWRAVGETSAGALHS